MRSAAATPFYFESLVWDWPIAVYLFFVGISAGLVTLSILLRRYHPQSGSAKSSVLGTTLVIAPVAVILGLLILIFHLARPWTFWKLMFHYNFTSVMSVGVLLFQVYMVVLILWLAQIFSNQVSALQQRWLPNLRRLFDWGLDLLFRIRYPLETLMLVLAVMLGAYTGFLLSALKSYPMLNNPILPALFLFSGISSGASVAILLAVYGFKQCPESEEIHFVHKMEAPVIWLEIFLLIAFFVGLWLGDEGKTRALAVALGGGFWTWWFWTGVVGVGLVLPLIVNMPWIRSKCIERHSLWLACGASLVGVLLLRFFILYVGQMTVA